MRNDKLKTIIIALFLIVFALNFSIASKGALNEEVSFYLDELKEIIYGSDDTCWKKPAQNRKDSMYSKISALESLIEQEELKDAYGKLLNDIKPKLTGLKTDENEDPWGNGVLKNPWVISPGLNEEFRIICNLILSQINPSLIIDLLPPIIDHPEDIQYAFESTENEIIWSASDEHPDTFTVLVDGDYHESGSWVSESPIVINIDGLTIGTHEVVITVLDAYGNFAEDVVLVTVYEIDTTPPEIYLQYDGSYVEDDPGEWKVYTGDLVSGLGDVYISLSFNGQIYYEIQENLGGIKEYVLYKVPLQGIVGMHFLNVIVTNDINYDGVQEVNEIERSVEIDPYIPPEPS